MGRAKLQRLQYFDGGCLYSDIGVDFPHFLDEVWLPDGHFLGHLPDLPTDPSFPSLLQPKPSHKKIDPADNMRI